MSTSTDHPHRGNGNRDTVRPAAGDTGTLTASATGDAVDDMVRADRHGRSASEAARHSAAGAASSDAVEQVRRSLTDLKHDVRMLKVGMDKQSAAIDRLVAYLEQQQDRTD